MRPTPLSPSGFRNNPQRSVPRADFRNLWDLSLPADEKQKGIQVPPPEQAKLRGVAPNVIPGRNGQVPKLRQNVGGMVPCEAELRLDEGGYQRSDPRDPLVKTQLPREPVWAVDRHAISLIIEKGEPSQKGYEGRIDKPYGYSVVPAGG